MNPREEADRIVRQALGVGGPEPANRIHRASDPRLPQFGFEWHTGKQKVYLIDASAAGRWEGGEWIAPPAGTRLSAVVIAEHCLTHGMFFGFVQTFCRAYLLAQSHALAGRLASRAAERLLLGNPCPPG